MANSNLSILRVDQANFTSMKNFEGVAAQLNMIPVIPSYNLPEFWVIVDWGNKTAIAEPYLSSAVKHLDKALAKMDSESVMSVLVSNLPTVKTKTTSTDDLVPEAYHSLASELMYLSRELNEEDVNTKEIRARLDLLSELASTAKAIGIEHHEIRKLQVLKRNVKKLPPAKVPAPEDR